MKCSLCDYYRASVCHYCATNNTEYQKHRINYLNTVLETAKYQSEVNSILQRSLHSDTSQEDDPRVITLANQLTTVDALAQRRKCQRIQKVIDVYSKPARVAAPAVPVVTAAETSPPATERSVNHLQLQIVKTQNLKFDELCTLLVVTPTSISFVSTLCASLLNTHEYPAINFSLEQTSKLLQIASTIFGIYFPYSMRHVPLEKPVFEHDITQLKQFIRYISEVVYNTHLLANFRGIATTLSTLLLPETLWRCWKQPDREIHQRLDFEDIQARIFELVAGVCGT